MKLSDHEPQQMIVQFPLPMAEKLQKNPGEPCRGRIYPTQFFHTFSGPARYCESPSLRSISWPRASARARSRPGITAKYAKELLRS